MPLLIWGMPPAVLLIVVDHLRSGFARFNLGAHFLDERFLLFQFCFESVNFLLLPLHCTVLFEELVEQHRVHGFVADAVNFPVGVAHNQIGVHLFYLLGHQAKLRDAIWIKLVLVTEGHWIKRKDRFACIVHRFDCFLETCRGRCRAQFALAVYENWRAIRNSFPHNASDKGGGLGSYRADADRAALASNTLVSYIDIVVAGCEILTSKIP